MGTIANKMWARRALTSFFACQEWKQKSKRMADKGLRQKLFLTEAGPLSTLLTNIALFG
jgi:hypothetical protein